MSLWRLEQTRQRERERYKQTYRRTCGTSSHCSAASIASVAWAVDWSALQSSQSGHRPIRTCTTVTYVHRRTQLSHTQPYTHRCTRTAVACWLERWTYDREVVSSTPGRVAIKWMGDCQRTGVSVGLCNRHQDQLSLPSLRGRYIEYLPAWLRLRRGAFTSVSRQVTLCDPIRQVTLRSSEMCSHQEQQTRFNLQQQTPRSTAITDR